MTGDDLRELVAGICHRAGHPALAQEIRVPNGDTIARPARALTQAEALTMTQVWRLGYRAAGCPVCPHDVVGVRAVQDCPCPIGSVPDFDNEHVVANVLARLVRPV